MRSCCLIGLLGVTILHAPAAAHIQPAPRLIAPAFIVAGDPTTLVVAGVSPGKTARVHAFRRTATSSLQNGRPVERPVTTHAWADYRADASGRVGLDTSRPLAGTYSGSDFNGLPWSGWPIGDERLKGGRRSEFVYAAPPEPGQLVLRVE
jgi:hypothetical protein